MNAFGEFLYQLRRERGMTQAQLADILGVTNKAVSKWETGEAMPETALLVPIAREFGVSVDELLNGKRFEDGQTETKTEKETAQKFTAETNAHLFTRGEDEEQKSVADIVCGTICGALVFLGLGAFLLVGALLDIWHPYWVMIPVSALASGIVGILFDVCNRKKREKKFARGENPVVGAVCGIVMLTSVIVYLLLGALADLWHPLWVIPVGGAFLCFLAGTIGEITVRKRKQK